MTRATRGWKRVGGGLAAVAAVSGLAAAAAIRGRAAEVDAAAVYKARCAMCHGPKGDSKLPGMSFTDGVWKHGTDLKSVSAVIKEGVPGTAMLPFKSKLNDAEVEALAKYVRAFDPKLKDAASK